MVNFYGIKTRLFVVSEHRKSVLLYKDYTENIYLDKLIIWHSDLIFITNILKLYNIDLVRTYMVQCMISKSYTIFVSHYYYYVKHIIPIKLTTNIIKLSYIDDRFVYLALCIDD